MNWSSQSGWITLKWGQGGGWGCYCYRNLDHHHLPQLLLRREWHYRKPLNHWGWHSGWGMRKGTCGMVTATGPPVRAPFSQLSQCSSVHYSVEPLCVGHCLSRLHFIFKLIITAHPVFSANSNWFWIAENFIQVWPAIFKTVDWQCPLWWGFTELPFYISSPSITRAIEAKITWRGEGHTNLLGLVRFCTFYTKLMSASQNHNSPVHLSLKPQDMCSGNELKAPWGFSKAWESLSITLYLVLVWPWCHIITGICSTDPKLLLSFKYFVKKGKQVFVLPLVVNFMMLMVDVLKK